jgi:hypothetical protein
MSAKVANDLNALKSGLKNLAERLGHSACATGCDVFFLGLERELTLSASGELNPQPLPPVAGRLLGGGGGLALPQDPVPAHAIRVSLPRPVMDNLESLTRVTGAVLGKLGCPTCCSGFDIVFLRESDHFAVDANLNVHGHGRFA